MVRGDLRCRHDVLLEELDPLGELLLLLDRIKSVLQSEMSVLG